MLNTAPLKTLDPDIYAAIASEFGRQQSHIELIASENFTYPAVLEAQGSVLTNKYAEGPTPAPRPTSPSTPRCCSRATRSWP